MSLLNIRSWSEVDSSDGTWCVSVCSEVARLDICPKLTHAHRFIVNSSFVEDHIWGKIPRQSTLSREVVHCMGSLHTKVQDHNSRY